MSIHYGSRGPTPARKRSGRADAASALAAGATAPPDRPAPPALIDTQLAFDAVAPTYDRSNVENSLLQEMRARTIAAASAHLAAGSRILDLGCGPGRDAEHFARGGHRVTAIDWSPSMAEETRRRVHDAGLEDRVDVHHLGIHEIARLAPRVFDVAYSAFGPLNCVVSPDSAARLIADRLRPGGVLIASVIGRVCPWEIAIYGWRRDWRRLRIRFATGLVAVPLNGRSVWTRYYTPRSFVRPFARAGFKRMSLRALGLFVPPPYLVSFADRHPGLVARLRGFEDRVAAWPGVRACGDHFLIALRRT